MPIPHGEKYYLLDLSQPDDQAELDKLIGAERPGERIKHIVKSAQCRSIVVEKEYIDLDYRACLSDQYYLSHRTPSVRCQRLHLFSASIQPKDMLDLARHQQSYKGFLTLRPFARFRLSRTILCDSVLTAIAPPGQEAFLTCHATYRCNIAGADMTIRGAPWMQQDNLVAACASISLWVTAYHMSHRFSPEFRVYNTADITRLATTYEVAGTKQSPGLTTSQMMFALREMGYEPIVYTGETVKDHHTATTILYNYIESGIPVILSFFSPSRGGHAVVCLGHTLPKTGSSLLNAQPASSAPHIQPTSARVKSFIVNDDADGPFRFLSLADMPLQKERRSICQLTFDGEDAQALLLSMIVPLPRGVIVSGENAEKRAVGMLMRSSLQIPGKLIVRTFLALSNDYKACWLGEGFPQNIAPVVRSEVLSRWIWISEISSTELFYRHNKIVAHVVQDPAAHPETATYLLAIVNGNVYLDRNRDGELEGLQNEVRTPLLPRIGKPWSLVHDHNAHL